MSKQNPLNPSLYGKVTAKLASFEAKALHAVCGDCVGYRQIGVSVLKGLLGAGGAGLLFAPYQPIYPTQKFYKFSKCNTGGFLMDSKMQIRAFKANDFRQYIELFLRDGDFVCVGGDIRFTEIDPNTHYPPSTTISIQAAQTLMDDLWNAGIRPTEGTGSAGSLKATENHLNDMRKIAFNCLKIDVQ